MAVPGLLPSPDEDLWASDRLVYREAGNEQFIAAMFSDSYGVVQGMGVLPRPPAHRELVEQIANSRKDVLLSITVCLKPRTYISPQSSKFDPETWKEREPPQSIGYMYLSTPDQRSRNSVFGIHMMEDYRSQGYGTEAMRWMMDFGFFHAGLHKISLTTSEFNTAARHVYADKIGFTQEGIDRETRYYNDRLWDTYRFGLLARDWPAKRDKKKSSPRELPTITTKPGRSRSSIQTNLGLPPSPEQDIWASKRLVYRTSDDEDFQWALSNDPYQAFIGHPASLPAPPFRKQMREGLEAFPKEVLIGIHICLKPRNYDQPFDKRFDKDNSWKEVEKPIPIGQLFLSKPDHRIGASTFGITLIEGYRGNGYGTEAINWTLDFGFRHAALQKISLYTGAFNEHALHVYKKVGFVLEGVDREVYWWNGRLWDSHRFGILEREWSALQDKGNKVERDSDAGVGRTQKLGSQISRAVA